MGPSSSSTTVTLCELDTCPAETPAQELVVLCSGYKQAPQKDLICRFTNGGTSPAHFDTETQRITCPLPQVRARPCQHRHPFVVSFKAYNNSSFLPPCCCVLQP